MNPRKALAALLPALLLSCASGGGKISVHKELRAGVKAARAGFWQEAHFRFLKVAEARPDDPEVLNDLAVSQEALGQYDEALKTYKRALEVAPHSTQLRRNYARFAEFYTSYARGVRPKGAADEKP